jgi:hypothetical protein
MSLLNNIDVQLENGNTQILKQKIFDSIIAKSKKAYAANQFRAALALSIIKRITLLDLLVDYKLCKKDIDILIKHKVITTVQIDKIVKRRDSIYDINMVCKDFSIAKLIAIYNSGYLYDLGKYVSAEDKEKLYSMPSNERLDLQVYFGIYMIKNIKINFDYNTHAEFLNVVKKELPV